MYIHIQGSSRLNKSPKFAKIQKDPKPYLIYYCFHNGCDTNRIIRSVLKVETGVPMLLLENIWNGLKIWCWSSWENGHNLKTNWDELTGNRRQNYLFLNLKVSLGTFFLFFDPNLKWFVSIYQRFYSPKYIFNLRVWFYVTSTVGFYFRVNSEKLPHCKNKAFFPD